MCVDNIRISTISSNLFYDLQAFYIKLLTKNFFLDVQQISHIKYFPQWTLDYHTHLKSADVSDSLISNKCHTAIYLVIETESWNHSRPLLLF